MATVINPIKKMEDRSRISGILGRILPYKLYDALKGVDVRFSELEEIRCRKKRRLFVTVGGKNLILPYTVTDEDISYIFDAVCGGSLYAHKDTVLDGYVTLNGGVRVGIVGRAAVESGRIIGVYDVSGINLRLPRDLRPSANTLCNLIRSCRGGVLIYSPPGVGKTTLLRSATVALSSGNDPMRVVVIDTRGELGCFLEAEALSVDVLTGYPKGKGIEIALRTMNPQLIVCDEIGGADEALAIASAQNGGVPLLASAHCDSAERLITRKGISELHGASVFDYYVGLERKPYGHEFIYHITSREELRRDS